MARQSQSPLKRFARGGRNQRGRFRRTNRPRGEGIGFVDSIKRLFGKG
jgi:hypothetical protein